MPKRKSMIVPREKDTKKVCCACAGSGWYDNTINGKQPRCGACKGTGYDVCH